MFSVAGSVLQTCAVVAYEVYAALTYNQFHLLRAGGLLLHASSLQLLHRHRHELQRCAALFGVVQEQLAGVSLCVRKHVLMRLLACVCFCKRVCGASVHRVRGRMYGMCGLCLCVEACVLMQLHR